MSEINQTSILSCAYKHAELDFNSASSLKQQSAGRHVATLGHIILIPRKPVFALSPYCCVLSGETTNTVFGLTKPGLEPTFYRNRCDHANHYATDAVQLKKTIFRLHSYIEKPPFYLNIFITTQAVSAKN